MGFSVEIPRAQKDRYFAFRGINGKFLLIDDFVMSYMPVIGRVTEENFRDLQGDQIAVRLALN